MDKTNKAFRDLYPELTEEELKEAEFNLKGYLDVVLKIGDRLPAEELEARGDQPLS